MQICEIWLCFTWNSSAPPKNKNNRQKKNIQTYVIYLLRAHPSKINIFCNGWNVADRTEKLLFYFSGSVIFHFMLWVLLTPRAPGVHTSHAKPIIDTPFPVWYAFSRPLYQPTNKMSLHDRVLKCQGSSNVAHGVRKVSEGAGSTAARINLATSACSACERPLALAPKIAWSTLIG